MKIQKSLTDNKNLKRDAIVRQAYTTFYKHGFHATGVEQLLADTGISKRTLYKYFRSKEDLIAATIKHYQITLFEFIETELAKRAKTPKAKILALFDIKREDLENNNFSGCFSINAKQEYEGKHTQIEAACKHFTLSLENFIVGLCDEVGCKNPKLTGQQILLLFDGAIVYGQSKRDAKLFNIAQNLARTLLG
jgi:AcrR family transcriptional regulator